MVGNSLPCMPHSFWDIEMSEYPMKKSKTYDECGFELHYIEYNKFQYELINLSTGDCYDVHETNGYLNQKVGRGAPPVEFFSIDYLSICVRQELINLATGHVVDQRITNYHRYPIPSEYQTDPYHIVINKIIAT